MATQWSVLANRKDKRGQIVWTEWRVDAVSAGGCPAQAGALVLLDSCGKIDLSLLPAIPSSSCCIDIEVNGVSVPDQSVLNFIPQNNIEITYGNEGQIYFNVVGTPSSCAEYLCTPSGCAIDVGISAPTHAGMMLISQPGNCSAVWADPQIQGLYPEGSSITNPPAYAPPTTIQPALIGVESNGELHALRTCDTFHTAQTTGGTSLQLAVWTPASGKAFRLMKIWISISGDAGYGINGTLMTLSLTDGPAGPEVGPSFDIYIPPTAVGNISGVFEGLIFNTGLIDMGNGYLSVGANRTLYLTANVLLATGYIRLNLFGTEE